MSLNRRLLLKSVGLSTLAAPLAGRAFADPGPFAPTPGAPRTFELVTRVEILDPKGQSRAWVPVPSSDVGDWFKAGPTTFTGNAASAGLKHDRRSGAAFVEASWNDDAKPVLEVTSRFATRDRAVELKRNAKAAPLSAAERARYLAPTRLIPVSGIVKDTSDSITRGVNGDPEKVRAIYEWVVDHTYRDPATRGCGSGDVAAMLRSGSMGGKCADINALFVGLVRSAGIPARDIYGIRVAPSRFGYRSLGANSATVTKSQHCRAEVYLDGVGWFPADPADVRKVALEEPPGHLEMTSDKVTAARKTLFGAWETNWAAYNAGQDVTLAQGRTVAFLMYPQTETGGQTLDCLDPDKVCYTITSREVAA